LQVVLHIILHIISIEMTAVFFDKWENGIDLRKGESVSDANRLRDLKNGYVTSGWDIKKRPGLVLTLKTAPVKVHGLVGFNGKLYTFSSQVGVVFPAGSGGEIIENVVVFNPDNPALLVSAFYYAKSFNGALYVIVGYSDGSIKHHYLAKDAKWITATAYALNSYAGVDAGTAGEGLRYKCTAAGASGGAEPVWPLVLGGTVVDGTVTWTAVTTAVTDPNCPQSKVAITLAQKIFAINGDVVGFSATDDPWDWTTVADAGFLPTGVRAPGADQAVALGEFNSQLVVIMNDSIQVWTVDPDPTLMALDRTISNIGTSYPQTLQGVGGDLFFLTPFGFRSIAVQKFTTNLVDLDIGTPVDALVGADLDAVTGYDPVAIYYPAGGQYWCSISDTIWVYSYSRQSKVNAWSYYKYGINIGWSISYMALLGDALYLFSTDEGGPDKIHKVDATVFDDEGTLFEVVIQPPYQAFKAPGILKQIEGFDAVIEGSCDVQHMWDARDETKITPKMKLSGDTRPGPMTPVDIMATEIATRFTNYDNQPFRLSALTYYYDKVGPL